MEQAARLWGEFVSGLALLWAGLKSVWIDLAGDAPFAGAGQALRDMRAEQGLVLIGVLGLLLAWRLLRRLKAMDRLEVYAERLDIRAEGLSAEIAELHNQLLEYQLRTRVAGEALIPPAAVAAVSPAARPLQGREPEPVAAARPAAVAAPEPAERIEPFLPGRAAEHAAVPTPSMPAMPVPITPVSAAAIPPFPPGLPDFLRPYSPPSTPGGTGPHRLSSVLPEALRAEPPDNQNR